MLSYIDCVETKFLTSYDIWMENNMLHFMCFIAAYF